MALAAESGVRDRIELIPGDATVTIREYVEAHPGFRIALLNLDFDTYAPTHAALEALYDSVVSGGVVICDEYSLSGCSESDAVDDYVREHGLSAVRLRSIPWSLSPMAYFIKP
jgi:predicted O-methyltransferase YrrM